MKTSINLAPSTQFNNCVAEEQQQQQKSKETHFIILEHGWKILTAPRRDGGVGHILRKDHSAKRHLISQQRHEMFEGKNVRS